MFAPLQSDFVRAIFDPAHGVLEDVAACHAEDALRRFNVYRNNVTVSLLDALAARFPVIQQIVGADFFKTMTHHFIQAHPPGSPLMMFYGDALPDFIAAFEAAQELSYLPDIARLEAALTHAYHAEDALPLDPIVLQSVVPEDLVNLRVGLHPSLQIVSSAHPAVTIFEMHHGHSPLTEIVDWSAQDALVIRPVLDVEVRLLPAGGAAFLKALQAGQPLAAAAETAFAAHPGFDFGVNLAGLFSAGLVIALLQSF